MYGCIPDGASLKGIRVRYVKQKSRGRRQTRPGNAPHGVRYTRYKQALSPSDPNYSSRYIPITFPTLHVNTGVKPSAPKTTKMVQLR
jgi:hypothetical protein